VRIFFIFWPSKIRVIPTDVVSSLFPPRCHLSSDQRRHAVTPCHTSFLLSQDDLAASASSSGNVLSHRLPSRTETEALNPHHCRRLPSSERLTLTLHCYKKIISILSTLSITRTRLYFVFSLARASHHRSPTRRRHFFSLLSHAHRSSIQ
jgi:hypothetical protein